MISILDRSYVYHNAASHSDPEPFRARMKAYAEQVRQAPVPIRQPINVRTLKRGRK